MRCTKKITILTIAASMICASAFAQDNKDKDKELKKAIVIEKDFVPVETKVEKPNVLPSEIPVSTRPINLTFSDWAIPTDVTPVLQRQLPVRYDDANLRPFRKRGYANFGMGNYLNISGNAGYRIIDKSLMKLGVWFQHNSTNGSIDGLVPLGTVGIASSAGMLPEYNKQFVTDEKLGMDLSSESTRGKLTIAARYEFSKFNYYATAFAIPGNEKQKTNAFNIGVHWTNHDDSPIRYYAGAEFDYFGNYFGFWNTETLSSSDLVGATNANFADNPGLKEYHGNIIGGAEFLFGNDSHIGMDGRFQILNYDNPQMIAYLTSGVDDYEMITSRIPSESFGMLSLTPYYSKRTDNLHLRIGAKVDISFSNGTVFRISPDVKLDWKLSDKAGLQLSATGGNHINTFHETASVNRYVNPSVMLPTTYTIIDAQAGLNIGLWQGLSMTPFVGFACTKDNMIPVVVDYRRYSATIYKGLDMNGVIAGIKFGWKFKDLVDIDARYAFTPQGSKSGYVLSYDRPEHSLDASIKITPIKPLDIVLSYNLHALRKCRVDYLSSTLDENYQEKYVENTTSVRLSNISNLNLGATYRINDMLHVYCRANNLLNRRYENLYGLFAQEFNIMGGIGVVF